MKILDACDDLSIQVHPPAHRAAGLGGDPKTEMWFIAHADPGAKIYAGLKKDVSRAQFDAALQNGTLADVVHVIHPRAGDCLFIPSGRIHAIGAGLLIYEIQQNSDTTYRVFDWNRVGLDGKPRQLHIAESLAAIDFEDFEPAMQPAVTNGPLLTCEFFEVYLASQADQLGREGENLTLAVTQGHIDLAGETFRAGDFAIIPSSMPDVARLITSRSADAQWLEIRIPG
jgi:mannose-6-phosphate isomerase